MSCKLVETKRVGKPTKTLTDNPMHIHTIKLEIPNTS